MTRKILRIATTLLIIFALLIFPFVWRSAGGGTWTGSGLLMKVVRWYDPIYTYDSEGTVINEEENYSIKFYFYPDNKKDLEDLRLLFTK